MTWNRIEQCNYTWTYDSSKKKIPGSATKHGGYHSELSLKITPTLLMSVQDSKDIILFYIDTTRKKFWCLELKKITGKKAFDFSLYFSK